MANTKIQVKDLDLRPIQAEGDGLHYTLHIERYEAYQNGDTIFWTPHVDNESGCSININGLGDIQLKDKSGTVIGAGALKAGMGYFMTYKDGYFHVINLGEGGGGGAVQEIDMVFDDDTSDLPVSTSQTIDGCTINDGDIIYVKKCADNTKEGKFYEAQVNGTDVGWIERTDFEVYNPTYVNCGTVYGGKVNYFVDYQFDGNVTFYGDNVTFSSNTTVNYDGGEINYNNTTNNYNDVTNNYDGGTTTYNNTEINYVSNYTLLGCTSNITSFPADVPLETDVTKIEVSISYDNSANDPVDTWSKTVNVAEGIGTIQVSEQGKTGVLSITWNEGDTNLHIEKVSGDGNFTVDVCQYSGGVIINEGDSIVYNDGTTIVNNNVNEYYDAESTVINEGDMIVNNLYVTNIYDEDGDQIIGGYNLDVVELADSGTTVSLNYTPVNNNYIFVYKKDSGLRWFEGQDYTYDSNTNTIILNSPLTTGEVIRVEYWYQPQN